MFHDPKNLRPAVVTKGSSGYPTPKATASFFVFSLFYRSFAIALNGVFTSFIFAVLLYIDALGKTRWHLLPACLLTFGYVEERGVCMLLRKAALACLVLAMRIDLSVCLIP
jgi:hypothetical protein